MLSWYFLCDRAVLRLPRNKLRTVVLHKQNIVPQCIFLYTSCLRSRWSGLGFPSPSVKAQNHCFWYPFVVWPWQVFTRWEWWRRMKAGGFLHRVYLATEMAIPVMFGIWFVYGRHDIIEILTFHIYTSGQRYGITITKWHLCEFDSYQIKWPDTVSTVRGPLRLKRRKKRQWYFFELLKAIMPQHLP